MLHRAMHQPDTVVSESPHAGRALPVCWAVGLLLTHLAPWSHAAVRDSFETAEPTFRLIERDCEVAVLDHRRSFEYPHSGQACEAIAVRCGLGTKVYFAQAVTPARVIDELAPSIWVKSNRAGLQVLARVVFPRTEDPHRNGPMTTLIHGSLYRHAESWQQLSIENVPKLVTEQVWFLRQRNAGHEIDPRGAFVDHIILNVYGGAGQTDVWIDDLAIAGHVAVDEVNVGIDTVDPNPPESAWQPTSPDAVDDRAYLQGTVLEAAGRPMMVKMIDHNGESFSWLQSLGFNTIRLSAPPTDSQLAEAQQLGLWLVAPPPQTISDSSFTSAYNCVLAWDLGQQLTLADVDTVRTLADRLRRFDSHPSRPMICNPTSGVWGYSRFCNVLVLGRSAIGSSFDLSEYAAWLRNRMLLSRGGRVFWAEVQTEPAPSLVSQARVLAPQSAAFALEPDQIRMLAYEAIAAGARGLAFRSRTRLDANDHASWTRAATLQRLNLELALIEPWVAGGTRVGDVKTNHPANRVSVLSTDRSRLLIARRHQPGQQWVMRPAEHRLVSFVDTGATSSASAFQIHPAAGAVEVNFRLQPEGVRVTLNRRERVSLIVVTSDPMVRRFLSQTSGSDYRKVAELSHRLSQEWLAQTEKTTLRLGQGSQFDSAMLRDDAREFLQKSRALLDRGDTQSAYDFAQRAMDLICRVRSNDWQQAVRGFPSPSASPFCLSHFTLPIHWALAERLQSVRWSPNVLPGGDCENLALMRSRGWRNTRAEAAGVETSVSLSPQAAHSGQFGLHLRIDGVASNPAAVPSVPEAAPLHITTAPVPIRTGQLVRIHGMVKVPAAIRSSLDGLLIYDSIGGLPLAERIRDSADWQPFTLYRVATHDGELTAIFSLSGIGEAWLDEVSIQIVDLPQHMTSR